MSSTKVYLFAIAANLSYSSASLFYSHFAQKFSPTWINQVKAFIAFICFSVAMFFFEDIIALSWHATGLLLLSGFLGLFLGDIMVFKAFTTLGTSRTLVLYTFQPLLMSFYGFIFLNQSFTATQIISVLCMLACVYVFMLERSKMIGSWDFSSFLWAFGGIMLDAFGVIMSREAYEMTVDLQSFQANMVRCAGALIGFFVIQPKSFNKILNDLSQLKMKTNLLLMITCFLGCFLSLWLYLTALKHAHVGTLASIGITGPVWVSFIECLYHKKWPSSYLLSAMVLFILGIFLMIS